MLEPSTANAGTAGPNESRSARSSTSWRGRFWQCLALLGFVVVPACSVQFFAAPPRHRYIHVESFRYGKAPSVIRCNRGDRLHLTFSTRDTGHSFFLEEYDLDVKISPGSPEVAVFRASDPGAAPQLTREVELEAQHPGWLRYLVSKSQYRCHVWCGPMHAFEHGNLIIWPNTLLFAGLGLVLGIPTVGFFGLRRDACENRAGRPGDGLDLFRRLPWLKRLTKWRGFQFTWIAVTLALLQIVLLTTIFGTKMSGRNFGVMVTWVVWLFLLTAVLTPLGGRLWCLACPLPAFGEFLQRGAIVGVRTGGSSDTRNRFFGLGYSWPKWLSHEWSRMIAFLLFGTFSTALVANPRVSGWLILAMVALATATAMIWRLRAFCRYLCPVSAFVGLYSKAAKLALRAASPAVCSKCKVRSCQKGSENGWACPYGLCVAEINGNADCGLCTECIKTCPFDNVTVRWRPFAHETTMRTAGEAWTAMAMLVLAVAYCMVHLGHWVVLRDYVNILDKGNWHLFGLFAAALWAAALLVLPGLVLLLADAGRRLARARKTSRELMLASAGALVPIGLAVWIAFVVPMLMVNVSFVVQSASDPFGWGWDFLGTANTPWHQLWPQAIPWIQVGCVLAGLHYSLRNVWRIWLNVLGNFDAAVRGVLPMAAMLIALSGWMVWFFAN